MKNLAAQMQSEGAAVVAPSPRAANLDVLAAYPWHLGGGIGANCTSVKTDAIAFTSKHRLRRPPDSWH